MAVVIMFGKVCYFPARIDILILYLRIGWPGIMWKMGIGFGSNGVKVLRKADETCISIKNWATKIHK